MADLIRMEIIVGDDDAELLPGVLAMQVPYGWEEKTEPSGETVFIVHSGHAGFCAELQETIRQFFSRAIIRTTMVKEENWAEVWKEFFTPVEGGTHFLVLAPWMEKEKAETSRIPIVIEPKMAFGTGHHATTALCLDAISSLATEGKITKGTRFLDLGTGSGILGLACVKLGLKGDGVDIDAPSIDNALENRALNGVEENDFSLAVGGVEAVQGVYQFILANILANPLKELAPAITASLQGYSGNDGEKGILVLSGMLDIQADAVEAVYRELGLPAAKRYTCGEWVALVFD